jgi:hypothetical protein
VRLHRHNIALMNGQIWHLFFNYKSNNFQMGGGSQTVRFQQSGR